MLQVEFQKLSQTQSLQVTSFVQEVLQLLREEIPELQIDRPVHDSPATVESRASSSSEDQVVVGWGGTPPSTPHNSDRDQVSEVEPEVEVISTPRHTIRRSRTGTRSEPLVSLI